LQCVAVRCSALQRVAACCSAVQCVAVCCGTLQRVSVCCIVLQCVAMRCSVLQCVAACVAGVTVTDRLVPKYNNMSHRKMCFFFTIHVYYGADRSRDSNYLSVTSRLARRTAKAPCSRRQLHSRQKPCGPRPL